MRGEFEHVSVHVDQLGDTIKEHDKIRGIVLIIILRLINLLLRMSNIRSEKLTRDLVTFAQQ